MMTMCGWREGREVGERLSPLGTVPLGILALATARATPVVVRSRERATVPTVPQGYVPPSIQPLLVGPIVKQGRLDWVAGPTP